VASDIGASDFSWGGYVVAELDRPVLVAGGGGLIEPGVGELFVLYADPRQRGAAAAQPCSTTSPTNNESSAPPSSGSQ
jgi:hypothetical protein